MAKRPDSSQAAQHRPAAIGGHDQPCREASPIVEGNQAMRWPGTESGNSTRLDNGHEVLSRCDEAGGTGCIGHHVRKGFARDPWPDKIEKYGAADIGTPRIGDFHFRDRIGRLSHTIPDPDSRKQMPHACRDRRSPRIPGHREGAPVKQAHIYAGNKSRQCDAQRKANRPTADNQNVERLYLIAACHAACSRSFGPSMRLQSP